MAFVFPVIGANEWSGGGWMPNTQTHRGRTHPAIDIYARRGASIVSPVAGHVRSAGSGSIGGHWIRIEGRDGNTYYFAHMDAPTNLKVGQQVGGGNIIGTVGNSGSAKTTKPHVHFSVKKNGVMVNPIKMLQQAAIIPDVDAKRPDEDMRTAMGREGRVEREQREYWNSRGPAASTQEAAEMDAKDEIPAWYQQLEEYRSQMGENPTEDPRKIRAKEIMHSTLRNMAAMTRSAGFGSGQATDTGIDEDVTILEREGER